MRTAIIGLGRMGLRHLAVARALGLEVVGAADPRDTARAAAGQDGLPAEALFADGEAMLSALRPECVIIASTAPSHCRLTCAAAQAGARYILCEKPMAVSLAECDRMIATCRETGTRLAVNHQMRFMDHYVETKAILQEPAFGGFTSLTVVAGNFGLAMNAGHYVEAFRFITGERPATVSAWFSPELVANPRGAEFIDHGGSLRLTTATGRRFYLEAGAEQGHGIMTVYAARHGQVIIDELTGRLHLASRKEADRALPTTRYSTPADLEERQLPPSDALEPTRRVLAALLAGQDIPDGETGRMTVEILVAAAVSNENGGRAVDLTTETLPRDRVFAWA